MLLKYVVALVLSASFVYAQGNTTSTDLSGVSPQTRAAWCTGQGNICTVLCNQHAQVNTCDPSTLIWTCTCTDPRIVPDIASYINSIPYQICRASWEQCNKANEGNATGQAACVTNIQDKCGNKSITDYVASSSTTSTSMPATAASTSTTSTSPSAATASPTKSSAAGAIAAAKEYGTGFFAAGLVTVFGLLV